MPHVESSSRLAVSVICTVRNDVDGLRVVLEGLANQTLRPDEVVITDGGSSPSAMDQLEAIAAQYPFVRLLACDDCNIAQGRNAAIEHASHDLIACIDAGCRADRHWLERITAPFADASIDVVGGFYVIESKNRFEEILGKLTMPGQLAPLDPRTFNPSARSLAFRRSAWEQAKRFPDWLYTAEDTLFDLKLRSMEPPLGYELRQDAFVLWRPRTNLRSAFRQFYGYARGEAHIGRGAEQHAYATRRYARTCVVLAAATVCAALGSVWSGFGLALLATAVHFRVHVAPARGVARCCRSKYLFVAALALAEFLALARWLGFRRGQRDRRKSMELARRTRQYLGRSSLAEPVPPWRIRESHKPRTLIVSWHWPPTSRACANVLASLFRKPPSGMFRVLTRAIEPRRRDSAQSIPPIPDERVAVPGGLEDGEGIAGLWANFVTVFRMARRAQAVAPSWGVEKVLAVYPHRFGLLAGWLIARRLGCPLVLYMHDLCIETLMTRSRIRRAVWAWVDRRVLADAESILVPTREFAEHYRSRGFDKCRVLPHCVLPGDAPPPVRPRSDSRLRLVYAGNVYEAHEQAVHALVEAVRNDKGVDARFLANAHPVLDGVRSRWVARSEALLEVARADVCVVALDFASPYPDEVRGCFPSRIVDYLRYGKPILAIVPHGCFVDRLIRESGCGEAVNECSASAIQAAISRLKSSGHRATLASNARRLAPKLSSEQWCGALVDYLVGGASREPDFTAAEDAPPQSNQSQAGSTGSTREAVGAS